MDLKTKYPQISALAFPPKKLFGNRYEKIVIERRKLLEVYVIVLLWEYLHCLRKKVDIF